MANGKELLERNAPKFLLLGIVLATIAAVYTASKLV